MRTENPLCSRDSLSCGSWLRGTLPRVVREWSTNEKICRRRVESSGAGGGSVTWERVLRARSLVSFMNGRRRSQDILICYSCILCRVAPR